MSITKVAPLFPNYCTNSKYLICIAAFVSKSYADYFIKLAVSTSALEFIIVAYDILFCLATELSPFYISCGKIISSINTFYIDMPGTTFN
jgi:hypothetical protein